MVLSGRRRNGRHTFSASGLILQLPKGAISFLVTVSSEAASAKPRGEFRRGKSSQRVIESDFEHFKGPKTPRPSHREFGIGIEGFNHTV